MTDMDRSQPVRGPTNPDDRRNYEAGMIWGEIVNALKSGWNHFVLLKKSIRVGSGTHSTLDSGDGRIIADGTNAALFAFDQGGAANYVAFSRFTSTFVISTTEGAGITFNATTGVITPTVQTPTLTNSWVNFGAPYGNAGYWMDQHGVVHLEGVVKSGTLGAAIFTLAAGYRPIAQADFAYANNGATSEMLVKTDGTVATLTGTNGFVSLSGITFRTV